MATNVVPPCSAKVTVVTEPLVTLLIGPDEARMR